MFLKKNMHAHDFVGFPDVMGAASFLPMYVVHKTLVFRAKNSAALTDYTTIT
jgi:hypothetical protein